MEQALLIIIGMASPVLVAWLAHRLLRGRNIGREE